jgi:hypothetical protein
MAGLGCGGICRDRNIDKFAVSKEEESWEEERLTSRFFSTQSQNPLQPHPASLSNNPCTSSIHSLFHSLGPRREMIISFTSWIEFSTLIWDVTKAE